MADDDEAVDHDEAVRQQLAALGQAAVRIAFALEQIALNVEAINRQLPRQPPGREPYA